MSQRLYCLGFIFNKEETEVILIEKLNPDWQRGFLNGIGGKVESNEGVYSAMTRECKEETGLDILDWSPFALLSGVWGEVHVFKTTYHNLGEAKTMEKEKIGIYNIDKVLLGNKALHSIRYLIPAAINNNVFLHANY